MVLGSPRSHEQRNVRSEQRRRVASSPGWCVAKRWLLRRVERLDGFKDWASTYLLLLCQHDQGWTKFSHLGMDPTPYRVIGRVSFRGMMSKSCTQPFSV